MSIYFTFSFQVFDYAVSKHDFEFILFGICWLSRFYKWIFHQIWEVCSHFP